MAGHIAERVQASFPTDLAGPARLNIKFFSFINIQKKSEIEFTIDLFGIQKF